MNANAVVNRYNNLTPEERFRLILAAGGRGDDAERDRLVRTGGRICLSISDHAPYAIAFEELAILVFLELMEEVAGYSSAFLRSDDLSDDCGAAGHTAEAEPDVRADTKSTDNDAGDRPAWSRALDLALAAGYVLRTKADGWRLFCERLNVPPFLLWESLPGFDRLQRALDLTTKAAFAQEGLLHWLNRIRPKGEPALTEVPLTAAGVAASTEEVYRQRVQSRCG